MQVDAPRTGGEWGNVSPISASPHTSATPNTHTAAQTSAYGWTCSLKTFPWPRLPTVAGPAALS